MLKIKTKILKVAGLNCSSHGSKISNSLLNKSDKSGGWFTFKFNSVKFYILDLRKHKHVTNKTYIINENGRTVRVKITIAISTFHVNFSFLFSNLFFFRPN